jgi:hypothetical protein
VTAWPGASAFYCIVLIVADVGGAGHDFSEPAVVGWCGMMPWFIYVIMELGTYTYLYLWYVAIIYDADLFRFDC